MPSIAIGCSPYEEDCVQVSSKVDYMPQMRKELAAFKSQLERTYPPPEGCYFTIKWANHDFGRYGEVHAAYTSDLDKRALDWALNAEDSVEKWDEQARKELGLAESPLKPYMS